VVSLKSCQGIYPCSSWIGHKTYGRCVLFGSASSFASTTALARSIESACGMSPCLSALETPQSKLRTSLRGLYSQSGDRRRNTAQHLCSQSGHSGTQHNVCAANQKRENQTMAPRSPTFGRVSLKGRPASIVEYRLKNCLTLSASSMPPLGFQCMTHRMNIPYEHSNYMDFTLSNEQNIR
jgi:hypothetical protein